MGGTAILKLQIPGGEPLKISKAPNPKGDKKLIEECPHRFLETPQPGKIRFADGISGEKTNYTKLAVRIGTCIVSRVLVGHRSGISN